jgi:hypothetical protein
VLPGDGVTCDYCDDGVPVVCRCGLPVTGAPNEVHAGDAEPWEELVTMHMPEPVHRIEDPEGIEGVQVVPCAQS